MKHAARASTFVLAGFLAMTSPYVCAAGQGGGHGGSGGHGSGGHSGHSSRIFFNALLCGQSLGDTWIGHSFAQVFGHRGQGARPGGMNGNATEHGESRRGNPSAGVRPLLPDGPVRFQFPNSFCLRGVFFPALMNALTVGFEHNFRSGVQLGNCSGGGFFLDPFFFGYGKRFVF